MGKKLNLSEDKNFVTVLSISFSLKMDKKNSEGKHNIHTFKFLGRILSVVSYSFSNRTYLLTSKVTDFERGFFIESGSHEFPTGSFSKEVHRGSVVAMVTFWMKTKKQLVQFLQGQDIIALHSIDHCQYVVTIVVFYQ